MTGRAKTAAPVVPTVVVDASQRIVVPGEPERNPLPRRVVARGLSHPRGFHSLADGDLLVSLAGPRGEEGSSAAGGATLVRLSDLNADGDFEDDGERTEMLAAPSHNGGPPTPGGGMPIAIADIAEGDGVVLAAPVAGEKRRAIVRLDRGRATAWARPRSKVKALTYEERRKRWYAVASAKTGGQVVRLLEGKAEKRIVDFPPELDGQPAALDSMALDPNTGELLVSLSVEPAPDDPSGPPKRGASGIVAVDPDRRTARWVLSGLTDPTDLAVASDGSLYVLESCDGLKEPSPRSRRRRASSTVPSGPRRNSGRVLHLDRKSGRVTVIANGLDRPTKLALVGTTLYVLEGVRRTESPVAGVENQPPPEGTISAVTLAPAFDLRPVPTSLEFQTAPW